MHGGSLMMICKRRISFISLPARDDILGLNISLYADVELAADNYAVKMHSDRLMTRSSTNVHC